MNAQPPPPPPPPPPEQPGGGPPQPAQAGYNAPPVHPSESNGGGGANTGLRILAGIGVLVLLFATAVFAIVYADIGGTTPCDDVTSISDLNSDGECYDGSSTTKAIALIFGWAGTALLAAATIMTLLFTIRGRGGRQLLYVLGGAVVLIAISLIIG